MRSRIGGAIAAFLVCALLLVGCGGGGGAGADATAQGSAGALVADSPSLILDAAHISNESSSVNLVADNYLPMVQGSSWVYDETADGNTTVGGVTRTVSRGGVSGSDVIVQELDGDEASVEAYTLVAAGIQMSDPAGAETAFPGMYHDLDSWLVYPNKNLSVGLVSEVERVGSTESDLDGDGKPDAYRLRAQHFFKGLKTVDVLGDQIDVAHFVYSYVMEFTYSTDGSRRKVTVIQSDGYAKGLGLVQSERIVVSDTREVLRQLIKLRSARVGGVDYSISHATINPTAITQIIPRVGGINPSGDYFKASLTVSLEKPNLWVEVWLGRPDIVSGTYTIVDANHVRIDLNFNLDGSLVKGAHNDTLSVSVCEDRACKLHVSGSPFLVPVTAIVSATQAPEPDVAPLRSTTQQLLTHDVVAAKYSASLERVVMVSTAPDNRMYLLDPVTGLEQSILLSRKPISLAISPDGKQAGVGQDGRVTWVNLEAALAGRSDIKQVNITTQANQVAIDDSKRIYVVPGGSSWEQLHTVDVVAGTEVMTNLPGAVNGGDTIVLRADGRSVYTQFVGVSSFDIHEWSLSTSPPAYSAATVTYGISTNWCPGPLWMSRDDARLVTSCGTIVHAVPGGNQNLKYSSRIPLSTSPRYGWSYRLKDLNQSATTKQWAALEFDLQSCTAFSSEVADTGECYHHLSVYDDDTFALKQRYSLGAVAIAGAAYDQEGVAVFHSGSGEHLYLITHLRRMDQATSSYLFQVVK